MKRIVFVLLAVLCHATLGDEEKRNARLLVGKEVLNHYGMIVENKDVIIEYSLYNVGSSAALKVQLADSMVQDDMALVRGMVHASWDRIPPGGNVTHTVVVKPLRWGYMNFSAAEVSYMSSDDATEHQYAYTSAPGLADVIPYKEFDRRFNAHIVDWIVFAVMTLPSLGMPLILWYRSKSKYEKILKQAKKASTKEQ